MGDKLLDMRNELIVMAGSGLCVDIDKFKFKNNKAAGMRVYNRLLNIEKLCETMREEVNTINQRRVIDRLEKWSKGSSQ